MESIGQKQLESVLTALGELLEARGLHYEVVLIGGQGDDEVTAEEWAGRLDTISYEVLCGFGPRLPRRYTGGPTTGGPS